MTPEEQLALIREIMDGRNGGFNLIFNNHFHAPMPTQTMPIEVQGQLTTADHTNTGGRQDAPTGSAEFNVTATRQTAAVEPNGYRDSLHFVNSSILDQNQRSAIQPFGIFPFDALVAPEPPIVSTPPTVHQPPPPAPEDVLSRQSEEAQPASTRASEDRLASIPLPLPPPPPAEPQATIGVEVIESEPMYGPAPPPDAVAPTTRAGQIIPERLRKRVRFEAPSPVPERENRGRPTRAVYSHRAAMRRIAGLALAQAGEQDVRVSSRSRADVELLEFQREAKMVVEQVTKQLEELNSEESRTLLANANRLLTALRSAEFLEHLPPDCPAMEAIIKLVNLSDIKRPQHRLPNKVIVHWVIGFLYECQMTAELKTMIQSLVKEVQELFIEQVLGYPMPPKRRRTNQVPLVLNEADESEDQSPISLITSQEDEWESDDATEMKTL